MPPPPDRRQERFVKKPSRRVGGGDEDEASPDDEGTKSGGNRQCVFSVRHIVYMVKRRPRECLVDTVCAKTCFGMKAYHLIRQDSRRSGVPIVEVFKK